MRQAIIDHRSTILLLVLLLAFGLRVHGLDAESLWVDEGYSIALTGRSPSDVVRGTAADQHPPLYYLLLHLWLKAGTSLFHIRLLSVFFGLLSIALLARLGRWLADPYVAVGAPALLALLPIHIWYSQEARMYILLSALGIASTGLAWVIGHGRAKPSHWAGYLLSAAAGIYTHNFFFFLLPIHNLIAFAWLARRRQWRPLLGWLAGQAALLLVYLPWLPTALYQARYHSMSWLGRPGWATLRDSITYVATGLTRARGGLYPLALAWTALVLALPLLTLRRPGLGRQITAVGLLWFVVPVLGVWAISQRYPLYQNKQLLIFVPGLAILMIQAIRALPRPASLLLIAPLLLMIGVGLSDLYTVEDKHGWREAAHYIKEEWQEGDIIYLNPAAAGPTLHYYFSPPVPSAGYPPGYDIVRGGWEGQTVTPNIAQAELQPLAQSYERIWLVQFSARFWDPGQYLSAWLAAHGELVVAQGFRGIDVQLYQVRPDG